MFFVSTLNEIRSMKRTFGFTLIFALAVIGTIGLYSFSLKSNYEYDPEILMETEYLVRVLKSTKAAKPHIFNVGPMENIKGAKAMGSANTPEGMEKFKEHVDKLPLDASIVIYCGCCKLENCPNVNAPVIYMEARGYTNFKILNIKDDLATDWIDKGYPMN